MQLLPSPDGQPSAGPGRRFAAVRLLLADDDGWRRHSYASELSRLPGLLVASAVGAAEVLLEPAVGSVAVDVVLLHLDAVGAEGVELVRQLRAARPTVPVAVLTDDDSFPSILAARGAGAGGYLLRRDALDVPAALRVVADGGVLLSRTAAAAADEMLARALAMHPPSLQPRPHGLTPQKVRVLEQLLSGCTVKDIATRLGMEPRTARWHVSELLSHFGVANSKELLAHVRRTGMFASAFDDELTGHVGGRVPGPRAEG